MKKFKWRDREISWRAVGIAGAVSLLFGCATVFAAQTNYLGTVFLADPTTPSNQAAVNGSGQLSVNCANCSGSGVSTQNGSVYVGTSGSYNAATGGFEAVTDSPSLTNGHAYSLFGDLDGNLRVNCVTGCTGGGGGGDVVITSPLGTNAAVDSVTTTQASDDTWRVITDQSSSIVPLADATAAVASYSEGTLNGLSQNLFGAIRVIGTDIHGTQVDFTQDNVVVGKGTAGSASGGVMTIQGVASMTAIAENQTQIGGNSISVGNGTSGTGVQRVTIASDSTGQVTLASGATVAATQSGTWNITNISGTVSLPTGAATAVKQPALGTAGTASADVLTIQGIASMTPVQTQPQANTSGGISWASAIVPNNTTAVVVKASAGQVYHIEVFNNSATTAYLKLYNATSAACGSGTPVRRILIPANTSGAGAESDVAIGVAYSTGITYCVTTGIADNDTGAPAANAYIVNIGYK